MADQEPAARGDNTSDRRPAVAEAATSEAALTDEHTGGNMPVTPNQQGAEPLVLSEPPKVRSKLRIFSIIIALCLVLFVAALDQTIVATAIPSITSDLHNAAGYTWIGGAYILANAAAGPTWAKCSDIWGRKPALLGADIIFAVGSILAATSSSMRMLIAARALQGAAGGGLIQLVSITISDLFSVRLRALYLSSMGAVWVLAATTGPVIGGALAERASWRWCFWINLPVCGLSLIILLLFLDVHNPHTKLADGLKAIDWFGTVSILAVTLLLLLGLDFGGVTFPWKSATVICMIVFGALLIGVFVFCEKRLARYPLIELGMFGEWSNVAVVLVAFIHGMVSIAAEYYLPLYFQSVKAASPIKSGILILPMLIAASIVDVSTGVLIHRTGRYREIIWAGTAFMTLGTGLYIMFGTSTTLGHIIGFEIIGGIGVSLLFQTPVIAIQNNVKQADTASAISTLSFIRNLARSMSIVVGGVVFQNSMSAQHLSLAAAGLNDTYVEDFTGTEAAANVEIIQHIQDPIQRLAVQDAYASSIRNMFILYASLSAVSVIASAFVKHRHMSTEHTETKTGIQNMTDHKRKQST
ncbi:hypothetical protein DL770_009461 [Monosporascus sp. CRB-9-2]|nr:hypothetical protein DL770_009461 [Monosporascus sp. CRB-9-2]